MVQGTTPFLIGANTPSSGLSKCNFRTGNASEDGKIYNGEELNCQLETNPAQNNHHRQAFERDPNLLLLLLLLLLGLLPCGSHIHGRDDLLQLGHVGSLRRMKENDDDAGECNEHTQVRVATVTLAQHPASLDSNRAATLQPGVFSTIHDDIIFLFPGSH